MDPLNLSRVEISWDVLWSCLSHALSTEHQEIMGLLLGSLEGEKGAVAIVRRSIVLSRKDKKKDRVEVGYENLAAASTVAERLAEADGCECRVLGWYHSHPHITVLPSHVDVRTQGFYQQLDRGFLGLIFSVFDKGRLEICAFQSQGFGSGVDCCEWRRVEIPVVISSTSTIPSQPVPRSLESLLQLQLVLLNEDRSSFLKESKFNSLLDLNKSSTVYHGALLRLIDLQLLPLLMSMRSHIASLQYEKQYLLNRSSINNNTNATTNMNTSGSNKLSGNIIDVDNDSVSKSVSVPQSKSVTSAMRAMEDAVPDWSEASKALLLGRKGVVVFVQETPRPFQPQHSPAVIGSTTTESAATTTPFISGYYTVTIEKLSNELITATSLLWLIKFNQNSNKNSSSSDSNGNICNGNNIWSAPLASITPGPSPDTVAIQVMVAPPLNTTRIFDKHTSLRNLLLTFDSTSPAQLEAARLYSEEMSKALYNNCWSLALMA